MTGIVFAIETTVLTDGEGLPWRVLAGSAWRGDDPLVARYPAVFASHPAPEHINSSRPGRPRDEAPRVEDGLAVPGEPRGSRRRF